MLHLVAESSLSQSVVERIGAGDDVVLQAGSIWAVFNGHQDNYKISELLSRACQVYTLQDLLAANGISQDRLLAGVRVIDYPELVELTVKNEVIHTWR